MYFYFKTAPDQAATPLGPFLKSHFPLRIVDKGGVFRGEPRQIRKEKIEDGNWIGYFKLFPLEHLCTYYPLKQ
jgi:hypothetical protein